MDNKLLAGERALITGAATGIGKGIAKALLQEGASVMLVDVNEDHLTKTAEELSGGGKVRYMVADLRKPQAEVDIVETVVEQMEGLDILVNCAGIYPSTPALEIELQEWNKVYDLNVRAPFFLAQASARVMVDRGIPGRIINITSTASEVARPGVAHYCSSKAALKMMTQVLALEWAPYGIRVNALGPGLVETETLLSTLVTEEAKEEHIEKVSYCPMKRAAAIDEIAQGVLFFASRQSSYVTGQTLLVDGGYSAGRVFRSVSKK
ncbi:SDR family NAD(P)-dependent oxidoreductase [Aneurinibacillus tyrosinisolvens]|uniref:SDR family NAD(P)-dependent oxidoreductase n=1 Tax=Aneurinibacillus tyrosinisolvens TaxID=1443435 RepID=UPI00063F16C1|nr:SDR family oxidoreductase [Aneurinibacillus tyrosinisolvens]